MTATAVWLDRTQAKLAHYPRKPEPDRFAALSTEHHSHGPDPLDAKREEKRMFALVAESLRHSSDILILGPGVAKHHFRNYLQEQHPMIARRVGLFQAMDLPSDAELQTFVERYLLEKMKTAGG